MFLLRPLCRIFSQEPQLDYLYGVIESLFRTFAQTEERYGVSILEWRSCAFPGSVS